MVTMETGSHYLFQVSQNFEFLRSIALQGILKQVIEFNKVQYLQLKYLCLRLIEESDHLGVRFPLNHSKIKIQLWQWRFPHHQYLTPTLQE